VVDHGSTGRSPALSTPQPPTSTTDSDVRQRRRDAALAGHTGDVGRATAACTDPAPPVRATALGALARLGALETDELRRALADGDAGVRRRACELAATRREVGLAPMLDDRDDGVVEMAAWALGEQGDATAVPVLAAMADPASGHDDPLCREAAVAALGAIGDPRGLAAVVAALSDKPAVRRRAAAALAAFDGPAVDAALQSCLRDRDWQVRQVAEDLLAAGD
jgi:HEAT repeat protein